QFRNFAICSPTYASEGEEQAMYIRIILQWVSIWLIGAITSSARAAPPVAIPDKNLEEAIRAVLHEPKAPLTEENLVNVHILDAPGKGIRDLTGLEKCKKLALLQLSNNEVSDLKALKDMAVLQSLDLSKNKISDLSPLAGLVNLQYLELSHNRIEKID